MSNYRKEAFEWLTQLAGCVLEAVGGGDVGWVVGVEIADDADSNRGHVYKLVKTTFAGSTV